jgi:hypothetical protein
MIKKKLRIGFEFYERIYPILQKKQNVYIWIGFHNKFSIMWEAEINFQSDFHI